MSDSSKENTRKKLISRIRQIPTDINAWLALADILDDPEKKKDCYEYVIQLDPSNFIAREKLDRLNESDSDDLISGLTAKNAKDTIIDDYGIASKSLAERYNKNLDYSIDSLGTLDDISVLIHEQISEGSQDQELFFDITYMSLHFGEIVRRNIGGEWKTDEELHKRFDTTDERFLMIKDVVIDPFDPFWTLFDDEILTSTSAFSQLAKDFGKPDLVMDVKKSDLAWICPKCRAKNMTSLQLRTTKSIRCQNCRDTFSCATGEVSWARCNVDRHFLDKWLDWVVRLQQDEVNFVEFAFTLRNPDFSIAQGDFLVILVQQGGLGKEKVVCVENKSSGNIIMPGK
jgi:transposase-like protein